MKRSNRRFMMGRRLTLVGMVLMLLACALVPPPVECAVASDMVGVWDIVGTLITARGRPNDPNLPRPGLQKPELWKIAASGQGLVLTSSAGSIQGKLTPQGAAFFGRYPIQLGPYKAIMQITIECMASAPGAMQGGEDISYFGINFLGQVEPVPVSGEVWRFVGRRR